MPAVLWAAQRLTCAEQGLHVCSLQPNFYNKMIMLSHIDGIADRYYLCAATVVAIAY